MRYRLHNIWSEKILASDIPNKKEAMKLWRKFRKTEVSELFLEFFTNIIIEKEARGVENG